MKRTVEFSRFVFIVCLCVTFSQTIYVYGIDIQDTIVDVEPYDTFAYPEFDAVASYLAGVLPEDSVLAMRSEFNTEVWQDFSRQFCPKWESFENENLSVITEWSSSHLTYTDSLFYPFSGPDFNYFNSFFPEAKHSVLLALEDVGVPPNISEMSELTCQKLLQEVEHSLYYNLKCSFFRTYSMRDELSTELLNGAMPLILLFIKSHGYEVLNVYPVWLNNDVIVADTLGEMYARTTEKSFESAAAFIYRKPSDTVVRELVYMSLDISDVGIANDSLIDFLTNQINQKTVFMKAASYLCHFDEFLVIKDLILQNAQQVITDPSGMPYNCFDENWDVAVHGQYIGPIRLFYSRMQSELVQDCKMNGNENLPFRFGYHGTHWCLINATRKN